MLASLHWLPVKARDDFKVLMLTYKALHGLAPTHLYDLVLLYIPTGTLQSQDTGLLIVPRISKQTVGGRAFSYRAPFLSLYKVPVTPKDFAIVLDAVPSGVAMLFRNVSRLSVPTFR